MEQYDSILQQCGMFNGIQPRKYREVLRCLNATVREYPRGAHIVELGEQSHNTGVLLDGTMEEFLYDENRKTFRPRKCQTPHAPSMRRKNCRMMLSSNLWDRHR